MKENDFFFNHEPLTDRYGWNSTKNQTRISAILGPWTVYNNVKASILPYTTGAYLTLYVLCDDQLSGNNCELPFCNEFDSEVCLLNMEHDASCRMINETIVDWSDAIVFMYLEYYIDLGFPYNIHETFSTGEWVGPYSTILAQDMNVYEEDRKTSTGELILDTYILKYLNGPSTSFIKMPEDCTLFDADEFEDYLGAGAVNYTIQNQAAGMTFDESFEPYYKTCDNGDVKPMLPYVNFTFVQANDENHTEKLYVRFEMKMLTYPPSDSALYYLMPSLQENGFPISGPYCYDGDPNRGYTFDLVFDSIEGTTLGTELEHSCIGKYECVPTQLEACNCSMAANDNIIFEPIEAENDSIGLNTDIYIEIATALLSIALVFSIGYNIYLRKRIYEVDYSDLKEEIPLEEENEKEDSIVEPLVPRNEIS